MSCKNSPACILKTSSHQPVLCSQLEAFTMNYECRKQGYVIPVGTPTGRKIAVVGMDSAGFGCAEILGQKGHEVTIFEASPVVGELPVYGTSSFKPAKGVWEGKREEFELAGVKFVPINDIENPKTIGSLFEEGFDAVFIDIGFGIDVNMIDTPGIDLSGVYEATDFLTRANVESNRLSENKREPLEIGRRVVIIGGGDATPDCLRTALKLGSEDVTCLCQYSEDELFVEGKGPTMVRMEGAKYRFLTQPVKFIAGADGKLAAVECVELKPGETDARGRRGLVPVEGSNFSVAADTAVLSKFTPDTEKYIMGKTSGATSQEGIFTAGDYAKGTDFVVDAMMSGRNVALEIDKYLKSKK
jgi:glutamate synthase (NADPH/NADH) small chain